VWFFFLQVLSSINILLSHGSAKRTGGCCNFIFARCFLVRGYYINFLVYFCPTRCENFRLTWLQGLAWENMSIGEQITKSTPIVHNVNFFFYIYRINETRVWEVGICVVIVGVIYMKV
jgi:hypothetical protein